MSTFSLGELGRTTSLVCCYSFTERRLTGRFRPTCSVTPDNVRHFSTVLTRFNIGDDCPIFADMYSYCRQYAGASLMAARKLVAGTTDIAINWTGGLHHAKKSEASGFCYVNDIVLAILELLRCAPLRPTL